MCKRLLVFVFFFFVINSLDAQIKLNVDGSCLDKNSSLLTEELIRTFGKDKVVNLLDNDINMVLFLNVDHLGNMILFRTKIFEKPPKNSLLYTSHDTTENKFDTLSADLKSKLSIKKGYFFICYERLPGINDSASLNLISKDLFENKDYITINVAFPGQLLDFYDLEKEKEGKKGKTLLKYDFLIQEMDRRGRH